VGQKSEELALSTLGLLCSRKRHPPGRTSSRFFYINRSCSISVLTLT